MLVAARQNTIWALENSVRVHISTGNAAIWEKIGRSWPLHDEAHIAVTDVDESGRLAAQGCSEIASQSDAIGLTRDQEPLVRAEPEGGATRVASDTAWLQQQGDAKRVMRSQAQR